jgi:Leucine Rich repeat
MPARATTDAERPPGRRSDRRAAGALPSLHPRAFARLAVVLGAGVFLVAAACRQQPAESPQPGATADPRPGTSLPARCGSAQFADVPSLQITASMSTEEVIAARAAGRPVRLDVEGQKRGDAFVNALVAAGALAGVRELRLAGNALGPEAMRALASTPDLDCLQRLDVSNNPVDDDGFALLCMSGSARSLRELVLDDAGLTGASLARLPGCAWSTTLQDLSLGDNDFADVAAQSGAGALGQTRTTPAATWSRLVSLGLSRTGCRAPCLAHLRDAGLLTTLQSLRLEGVFGPAEARILAGGAFDRLTTLSSIGPADLSEDESDMLGDTGLEILIASPMFARLARLDLLLHGIGDRGAASLAASPRGERIRSLELRANAIGDDGARALMNGAHTRNLEYLGLADTLISDDMADALRVHYGPRVLVRE